MAQVKIKSTHDVPEAHYSLRKINFDLQKKDGSWENQDREVYDHGNAVTVLLYNKEQGTVILTKQFRIASFINGNPSGMLLETCAGLLEGDEKPEAAILREIKEETGYELTEVKKVYEAYSSAGCLTELLHLYIAEYNHEQRVEKGGGLEEEGEEIRVVEIAFDDVFEQMQRGEIKDVKTIILLQYAKLMQLL